MGLFNFFKKTKTEQTNPMEASFVENAEKLFRLVTTDTRWDLQDEVLFNTFSFSYYGYCLGFGKLICFIDPEQVNDFVEAKLISLGAGEKYVKGLVSHAYSVFADDSDKSLHSQLIGIGHSHFSSTDFTELVNSIFENTEIIKKNS